MGSSNEAQVRDKARIFGRTGKKLTKYQERMNQMAGDICLNNPALLVDKGKLYELAKDKVHDSGYAYAKGKSRSKKFCQANEEEERPKREKIDQQERQHRIESLNEELKDANKHLDIKERRIEQAQAIQNYKLCDQLSTEVGVLKAKRRDIQSSLRALQRKEQRSAKYFARKSSATSTTVGESSTSEKNELQDKSATPPRDVAFEPGTTSFL